MNRVCVNPTPYAFSPAGLTGLLIFVPGHFAARSNQDQLAATKRVCKPNPLCLQPGWAAETTAFLFPSQLAAESSQKQPPTYNKKKKLVLEIGNRNR